jgi:hypothetical protein
MLMQRRFARVLELFMMLAVFNRETAILRAIRISMKSLMGIDSGRRAEHPHSRVGILRLELY